MISARIPLRFSLIGGGSDLPAFWKNYQPCEIISMAISYYNYITYITSIPYSGDEVRYHITTPLSIEKATKLSEISNDLIRTAFTETLHDETLQHTIITHSDVSTRGSGLGGSSSFAVGLSFMLDKKPSSFSENMFRAIDWEINKLHSDIGWQDHIITAGGGCRYITISNNGVINTQRIINADYLAEHILMFKLNKTRDSGNRVDNHDTLKSMASNMDNRAKYLIETLSLVPLMRKAIEDGDMKRVGNILHEAWLLKIGSHNSGNEIMDLYNIGLKAGAYGGKVSGSLSKGAGHLFFIAHRGNHDAIISALTPHAQHRPISVDYNGVKIWR